jgi:hypothetical protein
MDDERATYPKADTTHAIAFLSSAPRGTVGPDRHLARWANNNQIVRGER